MEAHLDSCSECRTALAGYGSFGKFHNGLSEESILAAQERIWKKLTAPELAKPSGQTYTLHRHGIWYRSVTLPLPAAAAAAVLIIVAMFVLFGLRDGSNARPGSAMAAMPDYMQVLGNEQGIVPITDMSGVLQYLSSLDNGDFMVIRLPESKNFIQAGEPALINAADYSRRRLSR